jgi:lysophospholipase L1-like esterase
METATMSARIAGFARRAAALALVLSLGLSCWGDFVDDESIGPLGTPSGGTAFTRYVALGTSLAAGVQSAGLSDSLQRRTYVALLAQAMGHSLGGTFKYPSLTMPGCPPPLTNVLTGTRVTPTGFPTSTGSTCYVRSSASVSPVIHNLGIPGLRAYHVLDVAGVEFAATDTLKATQFITGGHNPIDMMDAARPTFVTLEVGANDVLGAATRGDATLLTDTADFRATFDDIVLRVLGTGARVAVANVPNVTVIPHFARGRMFYILKFVAPTPPFNDADFTVDASCAPGTPTGDSTAFPFVTIATIAGALSAPANSTAEVNCAAGTATVTPLQTPAGPVIDLAEFTAITQNVAAINAVIADRAATRGWALVDLDGLLATAAAQGRIPAFPNLAAPTSTIFGTLFSLDGIHPSNTGYREMALAFAAAINATYGTSLVVP